MLITASGFETAAAILVQTAFSDNKELKSILENTGFSAHFFTDVFKGVYEQALVTVSTAQSAKQG